jgi:hypothetical protein
VKDTLGLRHLDYLFCHPGVPVLALELAADAGGHPAVRGSDGEPLLDRAAVGAYRERLRDLKAALNGAEADNDLGRVEALQTEIEALTDQLNASLGLGGRSRRAASAAERARVSATSAIRTAQKNIAKESPALARHIANCVKTGRTCSYEPEPGVAWE